MALTYDQSVTIANDLGYRQRVGCALAVQAFAVYNEAASTPGHAARAVYARAAINGGVNIAGVALSTVLNSSTIQANANPATTPDFAINDIDILNVIGSLWNTLAGA